LKTEFFIARRMGSLGKGSFSRPIVMVSIAAVALGVAIMLVSVAILTGFQKEIREKVTGFSGHIQITRFTENDSFEPSPIDSVQPFLPAIAALPGVRHIQNYATKPGIIKTGDQIQGVIFKGVGRNYDWDFLKSKLTEGRIPSFSDTARSLEVILSASLARMLHLRVNDDLRMYFISGEGTPGRKFNICGIFDSGMEEFDNLYVFGDIRQIIKLNNWQDNQVGGFEVLLDDFSRIHSTGKDIYRMTGFEFDSSTLLDQHPQIFDWLSLQDINVWIIMSLMSLVSAITMVSTLLILILERTSSIGILKALGMKNLMIRRIFLLNAGRIIIRGLFWGNLTGLSLSWIQQMTGVIKLPEESYYMPVVPVHFDLLHILMINAATIILCMLILIIPSLIITRISPVRAMRFS